MWDHKECRSLLTPSAEFLKQATLFYKPIRIYSYAHGIVATRRHTKCAAGEGGEKAGSIGRLAFFRGGSRFGNPCVSNDAEGSSNCKISSHQMTSL